LRVLQQKDLTGPEANAWRSALVELQVGARIFAVTTRCGWRLPGVILELARRKSRAVVVLDHLARDIPGW
jgi:hypothetical protein